MNTLKNVKTSINSIISLILHIVYKIRRTEDQSKECASLIEDIESKIKMMLKGWITLKDVIGGSFFGFSVKSIATRRKELIKEEQELKVNYTNINKEINPFVLTVVGDHCICEIPSSTNAQRTRNDNLIIGKR